MQGLGNLHLPASSGVTDKDTLLVSDSECSTAQILADTVANQKQEVGRVALTRWLFDRHSAPPAPALPACQPGTPPPRCSGSVAISWLCLLANELLGRESGEESPLSPQRVRGLHDPAPGSCAPAPQL